MKKENLLAAINLTLAYLEEEIEERRDTRENKKLLKMLDKLFDELEN